ncbi:MAG: 6-bladed beta-propeller [Tannerella sp.]|jgi:hypothetical protein|nr:6-bladed beta-propeller [Tannerella sp.]
MKKEILFSLFSLCAIACSGPRSDGVDTTAETDSVQMTVLRLEQLKSKTVTVPLSSFIENCELLQLETTDEAFFKPWYTTVTENYIGVRDIDRMPYKLFSRSGKFICTVGSIGQGPGEYTNSPYDDIIDEKNGLVYLAPFVGDNILVYNMEGKFIKGIGTSYTLNKPKIFLSGNVLTVVHLPIAFSSDKVVAVQFDVNTGAVLNELPPTAYFMAESFDDEIFNTRNVSETFDFLSTKSDTLYHFDVNNNLIRPVFTMRSNTSEKLFKQYFQLNKDIILTGTSFLGTDTKTGQLSYYKEPRLVAADMKNKTASYIGVVNDFYGGIPVPLNVTTVRDGYFVQNIQPEALMEVIEKRLEESNCTEKDRQVLNNTLSTLQEGANNVVFIGKLKSEVSRKLF